jgi:hypothetical protein
VFTARYDSISVFISHCTVISGKEKVHDNVVWIFERREYHVNLSYDGPLSY